MNPRPPRLDVPGTDNLHSNLQVKVRFGKAKMNTAIFMVLTPTIYLESTEPLELFQSSIFRFLQARIQEQMLRKQMEMEMLSNLRHPVLLPINYSLKEKCLLNLR